MQRLGVSCAVRRIYTSLGAKGLKPHPRRFTAKKQPVLVVQEGNILGMSIWM